MWPMAEYVRRQKATIMEYIATHPIFELCTEEERMPGYSWSLIWWEQDHTREVWNGTKKREEGEV